VRISIRTYDRRTHPRIHGGLCISRIGAFNTTQKITKRSRRWYKQYEPHLCQLCGTFAGGMSRCSACNEVWYCSKEHQRSDLRKSHKPVCRFVKEHPEAIFVKVEAGEGNGLTNKMTNYVSGNKQQGLVFVSDEFRGHMSRPLRSQFAELMGWLTCGGVLQHEPE